MKYFTISELSKSATASAKGIDNTPDAEAKKNLELLVDNLLDPLRELFGGPITVTSGYRSPKLNSKVKLASKTSQHMKGQAADLYVAKHKGAATTEAQRHKLHKQLLGLVLDKGLPFDQAIWEYGDENGPQWLHLSYSATQQRKQILRTKDGATYYNIDRNGKKKN